MSALSPSLDGNHKAIVAAYDELVKRACNIVNAWPTHLWNRPSGGNEYWPMRLSITDGFAELTWMENGSYDSGDFAADHKFPAEMLGWSDEEFSAWKAAEEERIEREEKEAKEQAKKDEKAREMALYAALKAKYD